MMMDRVTNLRGETQMNSRKYFKYNLYLLCAMFIFGLFGLGGCTGHPAANEAAEISLGTDGYVYTASFQPLEIPVGATAMDYGVVNDSLYYSFWDYTDPDPTKRYKIFIRSLLSEEETVVLPLRLQPDEYGLHFAISPKGQMILLSYITSPDTEEDIYFLNWINTDGSSISRINLSDSLPSGTQVNGISMDGEDRIYITAANAIFLFNSEGSYQGEIKTPTYIQAIGTGADGQEYLYFDNGNKPKLCRIEYEKKKLSSAFKNYTSTTGSTLSPGVNSDLLMNDGTGLFDYSLESKSAQLILSWADSGVIGSQVLCCAPLSDGRIAVITSDSSATAELVYLEKRPASEIPGREVIVMASLRSSSDASDLSKRIAAFNKSNDKYWIVLKTYGESSDDMDAILRVRVAFGQDLTTTHDIDLVDLDYMVDSAVYAGKDAFEDLTPYIESSTSLALDDFPAVLLQDSSVNGKLISLPVNLYIDTFLGKTEILEKSEILGDKTSLTLDDLLTLIREYPDAQLFRSNKINALSTLLDNYVNVFLNWDTLTCNFETEEFAKLLEIADHFPDEFPTYEDSKWELFRNDTLLLPSNLLFSVTEYQDIFEYMKGVPITFVGYPNGDGLSGIHFDSSSNYAICAKSRHKEGAWAFLEWLQTSYEVVEYQIPAYKPNFDKMIESVLAEKYVTASDNTQVLVPKHYIQFDDGTRKDLYAPTQDVVDGFLALMQSVSPNPPANFGISSGIRTIVVQEASSYFNKEKTALEVASNVQNRVSVFMKEMQ
jgi:ABC-type glycerol-3-phosphate transport system substrate-binding protein